MDRLDTMRVFIAVAEAEGFAAAARRLGMSAPTVTRSISALEDRIGTRLLQRTTRIVRLTEAGTRFLADCKRILGEIEDAEASAAGSHAEPRGQIAVTASVNFGRMHVAPILFDFLVRYPGVTTRMLLVDRVVDLMEEGFDVAVRIAHLPDSSLSAARVGEVRRVVCASPHYLASRGMPQEPADLSRHNVIVFSQTTMLQDWLFESAAGTLPVRPPAQLIVNTADVAIAAAVAGHGLTRVLSYQIAPELKAGQLKTVLAEFEPPPLPVHVVHVAGRRASARVRAFVDFMAERLRKDAALNRPEPSDDSHHHRL